MIFENPIQFDIKKQIDNKEIVYTNLMEVCQGGPEIGDISINGIKINNYRFGGPFLYQEGYLYTPVYVRGFFRSGFKLAEINIETLNIEILSKTKGLIFLDKIEGNRIHFFEDLNRTISKYHDL